MKTKGFCGTITTRIDKFQNFKVPFLDQKFEID